MFCRGYSAFENMGQDFSNPARLEYLQIGGTALRFLTIDIQRIGLGIQTGVAEAPAGERIWRTQPLEVYTALGQELLYFGGGLELVWVGLSLQIYKHDVQKESVFHSL